VDDYQKHLRELQDCGDLSGQAEMLGAMAGAYADRCEWDLALDSYKESLALFGQVGEIYNQAQIMFNMALVYKDKGDLGQAESIFGQSLQIFKISMQSPVLPWPS